MCANAFPGSKYRKNLGFLYLWFFQLIWNMTFASTSHPKNCMSSRSSTQPTMWGQRQDGAQRSTLGLSKVKYLRWRFRGHCDLFQHCPLLHPTFLSSLIPSSRRQGVWFNFCSELSGFSGGAGWDTNYVGLHSIAQLIFLLEAVPLRYEQSLGLNFCLCISATTCPV